MFFKSFKIGGIPIHKIWNSGLYPNLDVLAKQWQIHTGAPCPFRASKLWPREVVTGVLFAIFFFIIAIGYPVGNWLWIINFTFFALANLRIIEKYKSLGVKNAKEFCGLVQELDEALKVSTPFGLAGLATAGILIENLEYRAKKLEEMFKVKISELTYMLVWSGHEDTGSVPSWRKARNQLCNVVETLGFDMGPYRDYHQAAEEKYRREHPEPAEREYHLAGRAAD